MSGRGDRNGGWRGDGWSIRNRVEGGQDGLGDLEVRTGPARFSTDEEGRGGDVFNEDLEGPLVNGVDLRILVKTSKERAEGDEGLGTHLNPRVTLPQRVLLVRQEDSL